MYKIRGLFHCNHPLHRRFDSEVSPYHVLRDKKCYPEGCVEFLWRCRLSGKGKKCPRGYRHVGRNCFSCKQYYEIKVCRTPETNLDEKELAQYFKDLDEFEFWLSGLEDKKVEFSGTIADINPSLQMFRDNGRSSTRLNGFIITFDSGHIGIDLFDDPLYLRIGSTFLARWRPAPGDQLEFRALLAIERGRMVLSRPTGIELTRGDSEPVTDFSKALVARATGRIVRDDISLCRHCQYGSLLDVHELRPKENHYRRFYCLKGNENAASCPVRLSQILSHSQPSAAEA